MDRIPEPDLMDDDEQARAYSEADFSEPHDAFVAMFAKTFPERHEGRALDLGCGPGDITVRFAIANEELHIDGVDGAEAMLRFGRRRVESHPCAGRVNLVHGYLPDCALPQADYDVIFSNSLLHHLHDPDALWSTIKRAGRSGSVVFVMDLMRPASAEAARALVDEHARGEPPVLQRDFHASLLAAYTVDEVRAQLARHDLQHLTVEATSDRHFAVSGKL